MRIYGHWTCSKCENPVSLIKQGKRRGLSQRSFPGLCRQRITYFCSYCQMDTSRINRVRSHRHELCLTLKPCNCGLRPALLQALHTPRRFFLVQVRSSVDRRAYLSCPKRRGSRYDDGGCGISGPWEGCGFHVWLDEVATLPECHCAFVSIMSRCKCCGQAGVISSRGARPEVCQAEQL